MKKEISFRDTKYIWVCLFMGLVGFILLSWSIDFTVGQAFLAAISATSLALMGGLAGYMAGKSRAPEVKE